MSETPKRPVKCVFVLGASGSVGRQIVTQAVERGLTVTAQTRNSTKLESTKDAVQVVSLDPKDAKGLKEALLGQDAVIFSIGDISRGTTLFSDVTRALLPAMKAAGVQRLIAITGVGAGETRGHGGFLYDRLIFPLFTKDAYADKNVQESLIEASGLDWVIVRPAPFREKQCPSKLQEITRVEADTKLRRITRSEVASFTLDQLASDKYLFAKVFVGHP